MPWHFLSQATSHKSLATFQSKRRTTMKGFKTIGFNLLAAILPVLQAADLTDILGLHGMSVYGIVITAANLFLRSVTDTEVFKAK
jgi:hypothetical protein